METARSPDSLPIVGTWKLVEGTIEKSNREVDYPFGENAQGFIMYSENGFMSVHLWRPERPRFASGDQQRGTPDEIKAAFEGYLSYYGPYDYDEESSVVVHHVVSHSLPNVEGVDYRRHVEFRGNQVSLTSEPVSWGGEEIVAVMKFERVE